MGWLGRTRNRVRQACYLTSREAEETGVMRAVCTQDHAEHLKEKAVRRVNPAQRSRLFPRRNNASAENLTMMRG